MNMKEAREKMICEYFSDKQTFKIDNYEITFSKEKNFFVFIFINTYFLYYYNLNDFGKLEGIKFEAFYNKLQIKEVKKQRRKNPRKKVKEALEKYLEEKVYWKERLHDKLESKFEEKHKEEVRKI